VPRLGGGNWADAIAEVSERPEFQRASIRIAQPAEPVDPDEDYYNPETGEFEYPEDVNLYEGRARIMPIRESSDDMGGINRTTVIGIRVQIPRADANFRIRRGIRIFVDASPDNPSLVSRVFTVSDDYQGSSAASRTVMAYADMDDSVVADGE
jgi:hypothetical protein